MEISDQHSAPVPMKWSVESLSRYSHWTKKNIVPTGSRTPIHRSSTYVASHDTDWAQSPWQASLGNFKKLVQDTQKANLKPFEAIANTFSEIRPLEQAISGNLFRKLAQDAELLNRSGYNLW
jgi:hypothetical protein